MSVDQLREQLSTVVLRNVSVVQTEFDRYQRAGFIERPPEFFALELCGEAGELANIEKKRWRGTSIDEQHRAEEAADVFISLMNFCNAAGIDLSSAVARKLENIVPNAFPIPK